MDALAAAPARGRAVPAAGAERRGARREARRSRPGPDRAPAPPLRQLPREVGLRPAQPGHGGGRAPLRWQRGVLALRRRPQARGRGDHRRVEPRMSDYDVLVVGAGYAGSIMAERLASERGLRVLVVDRRPHIAGNAYDYVDEHGVMVHAYGPHIFHTKS